MHALSGIELLVFVLKTYLDALPTTYESTSKRYASGFGEVLQLPLHHIIIIT